MNKTGRQTNRAVVVVGSINIVFFFFSFRLVCTSFFFGILFQIVELYLFFIFLYLFYAAQENENCELILC